MSNAEFSQSSMIKKILSVYAILVFVINLISIFLLYTHYGPLTPNGNRYYHSFDISSMNWQLEGLCCIASLSLLAPLVFFSKSNIKTIGDVFPNFEKFFSALLTILNITTGTLFTILLLYYTQEYLSNHSRVMADDLETILLSLAYIACFIFWGIVDTIYLCIRGSFRGFQ